MNIITNSEALTRIFGEWPSFHDAEVLRVVLDRDGVGSPTLEASIHVWATTSELDSSGAYVMKNHTLVTLRFENVRLDVLNGFNHQNVLASLSISEVDSSENDGLPVRVEMPSSYGLEASFGCTHVSVVEAVAYASAG